ncbi:NTE family protein [Acinetobacter calcoaceticus]|uniref:NTE family protein n=1 Tax=Acinetobacter calcoaceticus TaxID=471 RepID=A0A4R1Y599_ACICA|nr:NTE family protein [Acinetobacter calcoaceticus]
MILDSSRDLNPHQAYRIKKLKRQLDQAESYEEWKTLALKLDEESGAQEWKYDNSSPYFDAEIIAHRLNLLSRYRSQKRTADLMYILREGFSYDVANIGHPMLFNATYIGTKKIIEDYIEEVSQSLAYIASDDCASLSIKEKRQFFENCQKAYGQPALMFSGGATLGLFHSGVCKALMEQDLMPKVLSGSSAGAIVTAMLGVSPPEEIPHILSGDHFYSEAFHFRTLKELISGTGGFADVKYLKKFLIENLGDVTFAEAYKRSGLDINVTVAPFDVSQEDARIMNKYTSPDLLVWSAVLASCAVPILFPPVRLISKRYDGVHTPYLANTRWVDGSVRSDFPQERMSRLYNLNYTIASQVNPHIVPFMQTDEERYRQDLLSWPERILRKQGKILAMGAMEFTRSRMGRVPSIRRLLDHGYGVIDQRYYGDVNIVGRYSLKHYMYMLQNPRPFLFNLLQREGERATWPKISSIESHARIGKTIEHCLESLNTPQSHASTQIEYV